MPSPKQTLLELKYPGDLEADVKAWESEGKTWRWMAERVSARCGYEVSYESLRTWYGTKRGQITEVAS